MSALIFALAVVLVNAPFASLANAQSFDFYEAKPGASASGPAPVVVFVHGGAWVSRSKASYAPLGEALAKQGYCATVVDYELAPKAKHPEQVDQVEAALNALAKKKSKLCKMDQWFLVGHSAGAHMISFWNSKYTNPRVKGFVGLEGIYDIPKLIQRWPDYNDQFITLEFGGPASWPSASPSRLKMKSQAPWLVVHSDQDELVDEAQSQDFVDHSKALGIPAEFKLVKSLSHFSVVDSLGDSQSEASKAMRVFIDRSISRR